MMSSNLRVLLAATEIYPMAKTGGLADAVAALASTLRTIGLDVHLVMPAYPQALEQIRQVDASAALPMINGHAGGMLLSTRTPDSEVPLHLVDLPTLYRDRGGLYVDEFGHERGDNAERFAALSHVIRHLALGELGPQRFDLVHCNDWHTGLIPLLLANASNHPPASVFTIHNMAFQGQCSPDQWARLGVALRPEQWPRVEYYGQVSFLKAGLEFSDQLTTVSPRYAEEIQTAEFGFGLQGVVHARRDRLTGILNGIDESIWSPERSPWVPAPYSADALAGKAICKQRLQQELALEVNPDAPLLAFIGRLTWQKMADVLLDMLPHYLASEPDRQFVLLGNGDRALESAYQSLAAAYPGQVAAVVHYSEAVTHQMHAGADILIHGSRFEPCGLTQLYAMRFGTIPVVTPVGGLADTVVDACPENLTAGRATGFYFKDPCWPAMLGGVDRAIALYRQPERWRPLQLTAMRQNFGWEKSARAYLEVYRRACQR